MSLTNKVDPGSFVSHISRTLAAANVFINMKLSEAGLDGLVPSHGDILMYLFLYGRTSMQQLAESINRDPSTVTALVKKLVLLGYVTTEKNPEDKRMTEVMLTPKGKDLRPVFDDISAELNKVQMYGIDTDALGITVSTLDTIKTNFVEAVMLAKKGRR